MYSFCNRCRTWWGWSRKRLEYWFGFLLQFVCFREWPGRIFGCWKASSSYFCIELAYRRWSYWGCFTGFVCLMFFWSDHPSQAISTSFTSLWVLCAYACFWTIWNLTILTFRRYSLVRSENCASRRDTSIIYAYLVFLDFNITTVPLTFRASPSDCYERALFSDIAL